MTNQGEKNITDAKRFLRKHIKLIETLSSKLSSNDTQTKNCAFAMAWCLNNFMSEGIFIKLEELDKKFEMKDRH
jgi:hypothetical protein